MYLKLSGPTTVESLANLGTIGPLLALRGTKTLDIGSFANSLRRFAVIFATFAFVWEFFGCSAAPPQDATFSGGATSFKGISSLTLSAQGRWLIEWAPLTEFGDAEYLVYSRLESKPTYDFGTPYTRTPESSALTEDLRQLTSHCFVVRMFLPSGSGDQNVTELCTGHKPFVFAGIEKLEQLVDGRYLLSWNPTPYTVEGIQFSVLAATEPPDLWQVLETVTGGPYRTEIYGLDQRACFRIRYSLKSLPKDANETTICNDNAAIKGFTGIEAVEDTGSGAVKVSWQAAVRADITGFHIYKIERDRYDLLADVGRDATSFNLTGLALDAKYELAVRAHNALGIEDRNTRAIKHLVSNTVPTVESVTIRTIKGPSGDISDLICDFTYSDVDPGQTLTPTVDFINDSLKSNREKVTDVRQSRRHNPGTLKSTYKIVPKLDGRGDRFTCAVTVFDTLGTSKVVTSEGVYLEDTKPIAQDLAINRNIDQATKLHTGSLILEDNSRNNLTNREARIVNIVINRVPLPNFAAEIPNWDGVSVPQAFIADYVKRPDIQVGYFDIDSEDTATLVQVRAGRNGSFLGALSCADDLTGVEVCGFNCINQSCPIKFVPRPNVYENFAWAPLDPAGQPIKNAGFEYRVRTFVVSDDKGPVYESWSDWAKVGIAITPVEDYPIATETFATVTEDLPARVTIDRPVYRSVDPESGDTGARTGTGAYLSTGYFDPDGDDLATNVLVLSNMAGIPGQFVADGSATAAVAPSQASPFTCDNLGVCTAFFKPTLNYNSTANNSGRPIEITYAVQTRSVSDGLLRWSDAPDVANSGNPSPSGRILISVDAEDDPPVSVPFSESTDEDTPKEIVFNLGGAYTDVENDRATVVAVRNLVNVRLGPVSGATPSTADQTFNAACDASGTCRVLLWPAQDLNSTHTMTPTPSRDFTFEYQVFTNGKPSNWSPVTVTVRRVDDLPRPGAIINASGQTNSQAQRELIDEDPAVGENWIEFAINDGFQDVDFQTNVDVPTEYYPGQIEVTGVELSGSASDSTFRMLVNGVSYASGQIFPCGVAAATTVDKCRFQIVPPLNYNGTGRILYKVYGLGQTIATGNVGTFYFNVRRRNDSPVAANALFSNIAEDVETTSGSRRNLVIFRHAPILSTPSAGYGGDNFEYSYYDIDTFDNGLTLEQAIPLTRAEQALTASEAATAGVPSIEITENFPANKAVLSPFACAPSIESGVPNGTVDCIANVTVVDPNINALNMPTPLTAKYRVTTHQQTGNNGSASNTSNEAEVRVNFAAVDDPPVGNLNAQAFSVNEDNQTEVWVEYGATSGYTDIDRELGEGGTQGLAVEIGCPDMYTTTGGIGYPDGRCSIPTSACSAGRCRALITPPYDFVGTKDFFFRIRTQQSGEDLPSSVGGWASDHVMTPTANLASVRVTVLPVEDTPYVKNPAFPVELAMNEDESQKITLHFGISNTSDTGIYNDADGQKNLARIWLNKSNLSTMEVYDGEPGNGGVRKCWLTMPGLCILTCADTIQTECSFWAKPLADANGGYLIDYAVATYVGATTDYLWSDDSFNTNPAYVPNTGIARQSGNGSARGRLSIYVVPVPDAPVGHQMTAPGINDWKFVREDVPTEIVFSRSPQKTGFFDADAEDGPNWIEFQTSVPSRLGVFRTSVSPTSALLPVVSGKLRLTTDDGQCDYDARECRVWFHPTSGVNFAWETLNYNAVSHPADGDADIPQITYLVDTGIGSGIQMTSTNLAQSYFDIRILPVNDKPTIHGLTLTFNPSNADPDAAMVIAAGGTTPLSSYDFGAADDGRSLGEARISGSLAKLAEDSGAIDVSFTVDEGDGPDENWQQLSLTATVFASAYDQGETEPAGSPAIVDVSAVTWTEGAAADADAAGAAPATFTITPRPGANGRATIKLTVTDSGEGAGGIPSPPAGESQRFTQLLAGTYGSAADLAPQSTSIYFDVVVESVNARPIVRIAKASNTAVDLSDDVALGEGTPVVSTQTVTATIDEDDPFELTAITMDEGPNSPWEDLQNLGVRVEVVSSSLFFGNYPGTSAENTAGIYSPGTVLFSSVAGDRYKISGAAETGAADAGAVTRTLSLQPFPDLNGTVRLRIIFDDGQATANTSILLVDLTVRAKNDPPRLAYLQATYTGDETHATESVPGLRFDEGGASDEDHESLTLTYAVVPLASWGASLAVGDINAIGATGLTPASHAVSIAESPASADAWATASRALTLGKVANSAGKFRVTLHLQDDGSDYRGAPGANLYTEQSFELDIGQINSVPTVTNDLATPLVINEDDNGAGDAGTYSPTAFLHIDEGGLGDEDSQVLSFSFASTHTTAVAAADVVVANAGSATVAVDDATDFGALARRIRLKVKPDQNEHTVGGDGLVTVTLTASDNVTPPLTAQTSFQVRIVPVNDAPYVSLAPAASLAIDGCHGADCATIAGLASNKFTFKIRTAPTTATDEFTQTLAVAKKLSSDAALVKASEVSVTTQDLTGGEYLVTVAIRPEADVHGSFDLTLNFEDSGEAGADKRQLASDMVLTINVRDVLPPHVTGFTTTAGAQAKLGEDVYLDVHFDEPVKVSGTPAPYIALETGTVDHNAVYVSGDTTDTLRFKYTVAAGDSTADLSIKGSSVITLGGTAAITDVVTAPATANAAVLTLPADGPTNQNVAVDGNVPTPVSVSSPTASGDFNAADVLDLHVEFSEEVTVASSAPGPKLKLATGGTTARAVYFGMKPGDNKVMVFKYTVGAGETSSDLDAYAGTDQIELGGTIRDAFGNDAVLTVPTGATTGALALNNDLRVDTTAPGAFSLTAPTAASRTNDTTPDITWGASAGVDHYVLLVDNDSGCPSPVQSFANLTATTKTLTPALGEGTWYVCLKAVDAAGNEQAAANDNLSFVVDTTPPAAFTITAPTEAGRTNSTTPTITWDDTDPDDVYTVLVDNNSGCGSPAQTYNGEAGPSKTLAALGQGTWYVCVKAIDAAGNQTVSTNDNLSFTIDTTAPGAFSITAPTAASRTKITTPDVSWTAASGVDHYIVKVDDNSGCASPTQTSSNETGTSMTLATLAEGTWYVCVTAVDDVGNQTVATDNNLSFVLDTTPPADFAITAPAAAGRTNDTTPNVTWDDADANDRYTVLVDNDSGCPSPLHSYASETGPTKTVDTLTEGTWYVCVKAVDQAGNEKTATNNNLTFVVDTTPPGTFSISAPVAASHTSDKTPDITWGAATGVDHYVVEVDDTSGCLSPVQSYSEAGLTKTLTDLSDGTWYVCVKAVDDTANERVATNNNVTFVVDTTGPGTFSITAPTAASHIKVTTPVVTWTAASGVDHYVVKVDDTSGCGSPTQTSANETGTSMTLAALGEGTWYVCVAAVDDVGNQTAATSNNLSFVVDTTLPADFTITAPAAASRTNNTTPNVTWDDADANDRYTVLIDNDSGCPSPLFNYTNETGPTKTLGTLTEGTWYVCVKAVDQAGNEKTSTNNNLSFTVDTTAPGVFAISAPTAASHTNISTPDISWGAAAGVDHYVVLVDDTSGCGSPTLTYSSETGTSKTLDTLAQGDWYVCVTAVDLAGNQRSATNNNLSFTVDTTDPGDFAITSPSASGYVTSATPSVTWNAAVGVNHYALLVDDNSGCPSPVQSYNSETGLTKTLTTLGEGAWYVCIKAVDAAGNEKDATNTNLLFTVDTVLPGDFSITAPTSTSTLNDNKPALTWSTATGADHYVLEIDGDSGCTSPTQSYGSETGTSKVVSTLADGLWYVCIRAVDAAGNVKVATNNNLSFTVATGTWTAMTTGAAPDGRRGATVVWDSGGQRAIVWGGYDGGGEVGTGGRYHTGSGWSAVSTTSSPDARRDHTAVWTGSKMIVWGGLRGSTKLQDGGIYDPAAAAGSAWVATDGLDGDLPSARYGHTAVWDSVNSRMIVWGGYDGAYKANGAAMHQTDGDKWAAVPSDAGIPTARARHTAIWTGSKMIVWGGFDGSSAVNDGGIYDPACPAANCWTAMETSGAPSARYGHTAVWTGTLMIVYGGWNGTTYRDDGATYDPATNTWGALPSTGKPAARAYHVAAWDGASAKTRMVVFGGVNSGGTLADGAALVVNGDGSLAWDVPALNASGSPAAREGAVAAWTGSSMLIWGGYNSTDLYMQTGARYAPP